MADNESLNIVETIRDLKRRDPFSPFRVVLTSGEGYVIESSDLLAIGQSQLVYCMPHSDRVVYLRVNQISSVDDLGSKSHKN